MLQKQKITVKVTLIMLMLVAAALSFSGLASSFANSTPVSVTVPTASLEVSGYAAPNALITIYDGSNPTATVTADSDGAYIKVISSIASGLHSISVSQQDINGIESAVNNRVVSIPPQQLTQLEFTVPPTINADKPKTLEGGKVIITGYVTPGQTVELILDNAAGVYAQATSAADGRYEFVITTNGFYIGSHIVKVRVDSPIGFSGYSKNVVFEVIQQEAPQEPADEPNQGGIGNNGNGGGASNDIVQSPIISDPPDGSIINGDKATIKGLAQPNSQIIITVNNMVVGSVFANSKGVWAFDYYPTEVKNIVTVVSCINNACSPPSAPVEFSFNKVLGAVDCKDSVILEEYRFDITKNDNVTIMASFSFSKARTLLIDWGDGQTEKFSVPADIEIDKYKHTYGKTGQYNGRITSAHEEDNCVTAQFFTVKVTDKGVAVFGERALLLVLMALVVALLFVLGAKQWRRYKRAKP